jgi:hypothetical protein
MESGNPQEEYESEDDEAIMEQVQKNLAMISALRKEVGELRAEAADTEPVHSFAPVSRNPGVAATSSLAERDQRTNAEEAEVKEIECAAELMEILDSCDAEDVANLISMAWGLLQSRSARLRLHLPKLIQKMPQILSEASERGFSLPEEEAVSLVSEMSQNKSPGLEKVLKSSLVSGLAPEGLALLLLHCPQIEKKKLLSKKRLECLSEDELVSLSSLGGEDVCNEVLRRQVVRDRLSNKSLKSVFSMYPNLLTDYRFQLRADQLSSHDVMELVVNSKPMP